MQFQNPGPWSFAIFAAACALVVAGWAFKAPEAGKVALVLGAVVSAWLAKSAVTTTGGDS